MTQATTNNKTSLKRSLKARHLSMIAIGGSIGTGLFVASGKTIAQAGPGGALLSYIVVGIMVYFIMTSLAELASFMPTPGSFATYSAEYVDEGFGFAMGLNYWYNWAVTIAVDLVSLQLVMAYWLPDVAGWKWSAIFLLIMFWLNYISVKGFGEAEFWFSLIKVVTVVVFIVLGLLMILGIMQGGDTGGWKNWTMGDAPFVGGFSAIIGVAMIVGFSFQGTELVGIAAGESENPGKNIPIAIRRIFWRILLFYVFAIFIISFLIPYTDPRLLSNAESDIAVSPFTLVFQHAGLLSAATVMNAVILTAVLSAGNSGMYASSRMLYALARDRKAPAIFARLSSNGVPRNALLATTLIAMLCFLTSMFQSQEVYGWLLSISGMTGFIAWLGIAISHYRFRKGFVKQGLDLSKLPYKAGSFPFGPIFAFIICMIIVIGQDYQAFWADNIDWKRVISTYIGLPLFFAIWLSYKFIKRTKFVRYEEMKYPEFREEDEK
ncbi:amino acid permease [Entomomonas sp. E2T0]|uniref:amino acid permease n=1 Tax=Entomomonas sp. E2T0 TaxID=2930213 RepID=UPI0022284661|nr:amino acid permease [Entomomonas sp. E2T0]UYZ83222.1 amino acid permease [Entomomonas sp. E2T0]